MRLERSLIIENTDGELVVDAVYEPSDERFVNLTLVKLEEGLQYINAKGEAVYATMGKEVKIGEFCYGFFRVGK